jgi:hypothetical protein
VSDASGSPVRSTRGWLTTSVAIVWLLASGWSLASGLRKVAADVRTLPGPRLTKASSSDFLLAQTPGLTSDAVRKELATVPADQAVLFVGVQGKSGYISRLYTFSLLALPRQLPGIACPPGGLPGHITVPFDDDLAIGAVIFDGVDPGDPNAHALAPGVWWKRLASPQPSTSRWTSFCPSSQPLSF